ncbi:DUF6881 domain-containing protein [Inquilinus sp. NPDC058860]|uniref:DUF6881 domain-containing protein n=1 Tax=Inquilinus sp. NPDC058860 TaxID=3346652 RepID=UPI0036CC0D13
MEYIQVRWLHSFPNEPVLLISELDEARRETRKIEIFPDGSIGYADNRVEHGGTRLGLVPVPSIAKIAADPEFVPEEVTREEFEEVWSLRIFAERAARADIPKALEILKRAGVGNPPAKGDALPRGRKHQ